MKTTLIRAFVLTLAVTGFGASAIAAGNHAKVSAAKSQERGGPVAMCLPHDPTHCGMD